MPTNPMLRNTASLASAQFLGSSIRFLYMLAIARLLGPAEAGIYIYGVALYLGFMGIGMFGQGVFLARRIGKLRGISSPVLHHSLTMASSATLIVATGLALFVWASESDPLLRLTILCFVGAMVARAIVLWVRVAYIALERPAWIVKYEIIFRGMEAGVGIGLLYGGGGLLAVSLLHFLFWGIEAGFSLRKLVREHPGALGFGHRPGYLVKIANTSLPIVTSVSALILFPHLAVILLRNLQPDAAFVGHFGIAMQFLNVLMVIPAAATQAFLPRLSRSFHHGDGGRDLLTAMKLLTVSALAATILASAYGPWFIVLVLGTDYTDAAHLFAKLCWIFMPYALVILLARSLHVIHGTNNAIIVTVGMTMLHGGLLVLWLARSPEVAAIGSLAVATICAMLLSIHYASRRLGVSGDGWWIKITLLMGLAYWVSVGDWAPTMLTAPLILLANALILWRMKFFDEQDMDAIGRLFYWLR